MSKYYEICKLPCEDYYTIGSEFMTSKYGFYGRNDRLGIGGEPRYRDHAGREWVLKMYSEEPLFFEHFQTGRKYIRKMYGI